MNNKKILMKSLAIGSLVGSIAVIFTFVFTILFTLTIAREAGSSTLFEKIIYWIGTSFTSIIFVPFGVCDKILVGLRPEICIPSSQPGLCVISCGMNNFIVGFLVYVLLGVLFSFFILRYKKGKISKKKS